MHLIANVVAVWGAFCISKGDVKVKNWDGITSEWVGLHLWFGMHVGDMWGYELVHLFV